MFLIILNLGCGNDTLGDIRIDIRPEKAGVNLIADAHFIPLRDEAVKIVYARSVLEHLISPFLSFVEMARVARDRVVVIVPNVLNIRRIWKTLRNPLASVSLTTIHLQGWDPIEFKHLVNQVEGLEILRIGWRSSRTARARIIHFLNALFLSHMVVEMRVTR